MNTSRSWVKRLDELVHFLLIVVMVGDERLVANLIRHCMMLRFVQDDCVIRRPMCTRRPLIRNTADILP